MLIETYIRRLKELIDAAEANRELTQQSICINGKNTVASIKLLNKMACFLKIAETPHCLWVLKSGPSKSAIYNMNDKELEWFMQACANVWRSNSTEDSINNENTAPSCNNASDECCDNNGSENSDGDSSSDFSCEDHDDNPDGTVFSAKRRKVCSSDNNN